MQREKLRVMLASELPEARLFLREMVEEEAGTVIVGEAENTTKALTLTKNLKPDIAIIDICLPHTVGFNGVSLSRIGGLDVAQTIRKQISNTRVILVTNLYIKVVPKVVWDSAPTKSFHREGIGASVRLTLRELCLEEMPPSIPVFTNIELKPLATPEQKGFSIADKLVLVGGLGIAGGLFLIITILLAPPGVVLALAGAATMFVGFMAKLVVRLCTKVTRLGNQIKRGGTID